MLLKQNSFFQSAEGILLKMCLASYAVSLILRQMILQWSPVSVELKVHWSRGGGGVFCSCMVGFDPNRK